MRYLVYLMTLLFVGTAIAQNPTIVQGNYITNVFGNSNFVLNPNALTNVANVAVSNATVTRSTTTPLVATSEFLVTVTSANGTIAWNTRTFDGGMKGQNCEARFTYRGFQSTSVAQVRQGATVAGANVVARLALTASTDPRIASINFPCGDLSQPTYFVITDTATLSGTHEIGGIYVGLATNMANVAQAEAVVDVGRNTAQAIPTSVATTIIYNTETTDVLGEYDTSNGKFTAKRAGEYLITSTVLYSSVAWTAGQIAQIIILKDGATICSNIQNVATTATQYVSEKIACKVTLSVGNVLETQTLHQRGTNTDIFNNPAFTRMQIYRFPSSSELVVTPERQNVWGAVEYRSSTQSLFSGSAEPTGNTSLNNATWNQPTLLKGKAAVTTTNSGNDLGFSIPNLPVGNYKLEISGQLYAQPGSTTVNDVTACTFRIFETTTSVTVAEQVIQGGRPTSSTNTANLTNSFQGIFNNTSVATRNFRLETNKTIDSNATNLGTCVAASSASGNTDATVISFSITPLDQPSNSALYVEGPVKASATGAAIPAGYVGEEISAEQNSYVGTGLANNSTTNFLTITLTPGVWLISASQNVLQNSSTGTAMCSVVSDVSASSNVVTGIGLAATDSCGWPSNNVSSLAILNTPFVYRTTTTKTIYLNSYALFTAGTPTRKGTIRAIRLN